MQGTSGGVGGRAAHRVGYASASQFTRDYHKAFGRTPGEDRLRPS